MVLELRPAHDPRKQYGFVGVVIIAERPVRFDLGLAPREATTSEVKKVDRRSRPSPPTPPTCPPLLKAFKAVPPLVTDIDLSLDDRFLYVSCWGTGEMRQYDVSDPVHAKLTGTVQIGGIVRQAAHPERPDRSTAVRRWWSSAATASGCISPTRLYSAWDDQFYPEGMKGWMVKLDVKQSGGITVDPGFLATFGEARAHQVRLEGGDASTDTFCFPS